jgi:hypothetical protein
MRGARVEEIEARMRLLYPQALTILVRPENDEIPGEKGVRRGRH